MKHLALLAWSIAAGALALTAAAAEERAARTYALAGHGNLELTYPSSWRDEVRPPSGTGSPTIMLRPAEGDEFLVMITPLWSPTNDRAFNSAEQVRKHLDRDRKGMLKLAAEKEIVLRSFGDPASVGFYFQATLEEPNPGEQPHVLRAGRGVSDLLLSATIFTRHENSADAREALAMLSTARSYAPPSR